MNKIKNTYYFFENLIKSRYFKYDNWGVNVWIFEIKFMLERWLFVRPIRFIEEKHIDNWKFAIDYSNIYWENATKFIESKLSWEIAELSKKEFEKIYNRFEKENKEIIKDILKGIREL